MIGPVNSPYAFGEDPTIRVYNRYRKDWGGQIQWIAFKILAAGAIQPQKGFKFAFENGADFANVGMFDFQVRHDAIITRDIIDEIKRKDRPRPWME